MNTRRKHHTAWRSFGIVLALSGPVGIASAQESASAPTVPEVAQANGEASVLRPGQVMLLREGSLLVDVKGWMRFDDTMKSWQYDIDEDDDTAPGYELTILPNSVLQEMIELRTIARGQPVAFEVSGKVLVYRGRSYFLPSLAPQLIKHSTTRIDETPSTDPTVQAGPVDEDSVQNIMADLERSVGEIARSPTAKRGPAVDTAGLMLEGTMLVARRGRLARTASGSWMFVFDADASGLSDPPMTIMPCLLLERMEEHARRGGGVAPMMISGKVHVFNEHNYLLPSVFQIPRERTSLTP